MVAPLSASLFSPPAAATAPQADPDESARKEQARIKAELLSVRSEKQCTTCEGDKEKLDQQIEKLETRLRRIESEATVQAPAPKRASEPTQLRQTAAGADNAEEPAVLIDPATAARAGAGSLSLASAPPPPPPPGSALDVTV